MGSGDAEGLRPLQDRDAVEQALRLPLALVYKHSPACWQSFRAVREVRQLAEENAALPVFVIDVIGQQALSRAVAEQVGVRHESPQVLLVKQGAVVWHASHGGVRVENLRQALSAAE